eukprot:5126345-Amphidinium_carterae.1
MSSGTSGREDRLLVLKPFWPKPDAQSRHGNGVGEKQPKAEWPQASIAGTIMRCTLASRILCA